MPATLRLNEELSAIRRGIRRLPRRHWPENGSLDLFGGAQFTDVVPWLTLDHEGLDALVHPLTDNAYDDHSRYVVWLGAPGR
jgi:aromatic ring-cleaving dioxygenase